jgi:hypothetical protein
VVDVFLLLQFLELENYCVAVVELLAGRLDVQLDPFPSQLQLFMRR